MSPPRPAWLQITSWAGICPGAEHYYGRICRPNPEYAGVYDPAVPRYVEHRLEHALSAAEALDLCRRNRVAGAYQPGDESVFFFSREGVLEAAVAYVETREDLDLLLEGDAGTLNPLPVVWCRPEWEPLKEIGRRFERLYDETNDPWRSYPEEAERLEDAWNALVRPV